MAQSTPNPGQPQQPPPEPLPAPTPQPNPPPHQPGNQPPRPGQPTPTPQRDQRLVTVDGQAWEPPPPATPTQEELDAIARGEYDPTAPPEPPVARSMEGQSGSGYTTR